MINRIRLLTICTVFLWVDGFAPIQNFSLFHKSHSIATTKGNFESTRLDVMLDGTNTWGNIAALTGAATVAQSLGKTTAVGRLLGAPVTAMTITFILASIGILNPGGTAASKFLQLLTLQLATPLVLLGADLRDCVTRCGPLLPSFLCAVLSTVVACFIGWGCSNKLLTAALGRDGLIIAAALMAKNIGGGLNYIAVTRCLSASPQAIAAGLCIDNIFALLYFPATSALASGLSDVQQETEIISTKEDDASEKEMDDIQKVCSVLFLAATLLTIGEAIGGQTGALPICSLVTVLFASLAPRRILKPLQKQAEILGTCCLYLFFATAGAPGIQVAESVKASVVPLSIFLTCLYSIHGVMLWALHKLSPSRAPFVPQRLLVASSAAIGGPATAVTLAKSNDWKSLVVPSILVGNIGYAIGTFLGLFYHSLLN